MERAWHHRDRRDKGHSSHRQLSAYDRNFAVVYFSISPCIYASAVHLSALSDLRLCRHHRCCEIFWVWICFQRETVRMLQRLTPSLPLLNLCRSRQQDTMVGMKCIRGIHRKNILTPAVHSLLFISSPWPVLLACCQISPRIRGSLAVKMAIRVTGAMTHPQVVQTAGWR